MKKGKENEKWKELVSGMILKTRTTRFQTIVFRLASKMKMVFRAMRYVKLSQDFSHLQVSLQKDFLNSLIN